MKYTDALMLSEVEAKSVVYKSLNMKAMNTLDDKHRPDVSSLIIAARKLGYRRYNEVPEESDDAEKMETMAREIQAKKNKETDVQK